MTEEEIRKAVDEQFQKFEDHKALAVAKSWTLLCERLPAGWRIFQLGGTKEIGYSEVEHWQETPWWVIHDIRAGLIPDVYTATLEECVQEIIYNGNIPPRQSERDARNDIAEKARQKREKKLQRKRRTE